MGHQDRPHAAKRTRKVVMPTVEEIVEEARQAKREKMAGLIKVADLAATLGRDRSHTRKVIGRMGIDYAHQDNDGSTYITREDAAKLAERLA